MTPLRSKLEQNLGWILLALLLGCCLLVLWPFVTALLWGAVLSFSSWPLYCRLLQLLGAGHAGRSDDVAGHDSPRPSAFRGCRAHAGGKRDRTQGGRAALAGCRPAHPAQMAGQAPLVGQAAAERWQILATDSARLLQEAKRFIEPVGSWLLKAGLKLGVGLLELALSILVTFFLTE